ncbi:hypothetical protein [Halonatronum saccharophilum]|uniref:hypothetical protein n=1 Tax=Halonatronum saccharophilum TaxID=150060 RepID=UPI00048448D3|nr:hypothetical protein [Halonatronum saccharophilum]
MIKSSILSILKALNTKNKIPFTRLAGNKEGVVCRRKGCSCKIYFKVLTGKENLSTLPKYHQKIKELNVDFNKYLLIYAGIKDDYDRGCEVKIDNVYKEGEEVLVKVSKLVAAKEFCLEVITLPYDLIKLDKSHLPIKRKFRFIDDQENIIYTEEV